MYKKIIVVKNVEDLTKIIDEYKKDEESWQNHRSILQCIAVNSKTPSELSINLLGNQDICLNITYGNKECSLHSLIKEIVTSETDIKEEFDLIKILSNLLRGPQCFASKNYSFDFAKKASSLLKILSEVKPDDIFQHLLLNYSENSIKEFCNLSCNRLLALHLLERGNKGHGTIFYDSGDSSITGEAELPKSIANDSQKHHLHSIPQKIREMIIKKLDRDDLCNFISAHRSPTTEETKEDASPSGALILIDVTTSEAEKYKMQG